MSGAGKFYHAKTGLLGEAGVGKTSLRRQYMSQGTKRSQLMTIGADLAVKRIKIDQNIEFPMQIWDIAGRTPTKSMRMRFLEDRSAALIVFDVTRYDTFAKLDNWLHDLWENNLGRDIPLM